MVEAQGNDATGWEVSRLIEVAPNGWLETGKIDDKVSYDDKKDLRGPINIAVALERKYGKKGQRVIVVGNGNFLANTFIGNGGNVDLGINMINWLAGDDSLITIQPKPLKDVNVLIPNNSLMAMAVFFGSRWILSIGLLVAGVLIWWKRRKA